MSTFPWRSRFRYGVGAGSIVNWTTALPARPWTRPTGTVGGSRTAAGGVPAAYVVRRDYKLRIRLRLWEAELSDLQALIAWGQSAESFRWYPDASKPLEYYGVYLESPVAGDDWEESLMPEFQEVCEVELVLRLATGGPFSLSYFGGC